MASQDVERTLVFLKPDAVQRGLVGELICRFERKGLKLVAAKFMRIGRELAERHYAVHKGKDFYPPLIDYVTSGPVMMLVLEAPEAVAIVRTMMGKTAGSEAAAGTIRGDLGISGRKNLIHGSDSPDTARHEIDLFFRPEELLDYGRAIDAWIRTDG